MVMDITTLYNSINKKLRESNHYKIADEIEELVSMGATGSEILFSTGGYLGLLKRNNPTVYNIIKEEADNYIFYCIEQGIIIK